MVKQDLSPVDLRALLWGYKRDLDRLQYSSPLTLATIHLWYKKDLQGLLSSDPSPLTSLFDNPMFPQEWGVDMIGSAGSAIFCSYQYWATSCSPEWLWLAHCYPPVFLLYGICFHSNTPLTEYERLCSLPETPRHLLSSIYKLLHALMHDGLPPYTRAWSAAWGGSLRLLLGRITFILLTNPQFLVMHRKRIINFSPNGTGTPSHCIGYSLLYRPLVGGLTKEKYLVGVQWDSPLLVHSFYHLQQNVSGVPVTYPRDSTPVHATGFGSVSETKPVTLLPLRNTTADSSVLENR